MWRKTRIVNRVEDKRFTLKNPATREKKERDSIVCQPFPSRSMLFFTRVAIPRQCGVI